MSYKVFTNGSVLNASELNEYLMNQSVIAFSNSTARSSAITSPVEGMVTYLEDTDTFWYWNGSAWTSLTGGGAGTGNAIINGAFDIWQRGTSFSVGANIIYTADRYRAYRQGLSTGMTVSQQAGTVGTRFSARVQRDSGNASTNALKLQQDLETVMSLPFAGNPTTLSFYAKAGANYSPTSGALAFGAVTGTGTDQSQAGGFTGATTSSSSATLTTDWQRFTFTFTPASNVTQVGVFFDMTPVGTAGADDWYEITGVQLEAGTTATPFRRNANSLQGELAACQRYYQRYSGPTNFTVVAPSGMQENTTLAVGYTPLVTELRTYPTSIEFGNLAVMNGLSQQAVTSATLQDRSSNKILSAAYIVTSGLTAGQFCHVRSNNSATGFLAVSAEL